MIHAVFRISCNTIEDKHIEEVKTLFYKLEHCSNISFSPYIEHRHYDGYSEMACTMDIESSYIEDVLKNISSYWQGYEDDRETDRFMADLMSPYLESIVFQF